ncbi:MAG TPA: hypothetical protein ENN09_01925 [Planctomycetes bacterium]|nr:hypothetical protein [Planctomycetota bacterium]
MVAAKFAWTAWGSSLACLGVLLVGAHNMEVGAHAAVVMAAAALGVSMALSAVAVGFGTLFPEPSRRSPGEMVSSFGGTLTLVVSLVVVAAFTSMVSPMLKRWMPLSGAGIESVRVAASSWRLAAAQASLAGGAGVALAIVLMYVARRAARKLEW